MHLVVIYITMFPHLQHIQMNIPFSRMLPFVIFVRSSKLKFYILIFLFFNWTQYIGLGYTKHKECDTFLRNVRTCTRVRPLNLVLLHTDWHQEGVSLREVASIMTKTVKERWKWRWFIGVIRGGYSGESLNAATRNIGCGHLSSYLLAVMVLKLNLGCGILVPIIPCPVTECYTVVTWLCLEALP